MFIKKTASCFLSIFLCLLWSHPAFAEEAAWQLSKDEEGVKIYTRKEKGSSLKEYKGVIVTDAPMQKAIDLFLDANRVTEWMFSCKEYKEIPNDSNKKLYYYLQDLPWPMADRDVITELTESTDSGTGIVTYRMKEVAGFYPVQKGIIRVERFQSVWQFIPEADGKVQIIYQYELDPSGSLPKWLVNRVGPEAPLTSLKQYKALLESPQS